ncbi:heat shock 70 kDa protein 12A-like [Dreissena polymorpha]|uniref:Uncharacterized protein n=1 Tax=Dreissena polymorpha TaxID=45954 RepID=A0A9D4KIY7_DREPO|nr:heat shock 70 kDa protein 12A-like [Dreissena polymorpha]XP_052280374.1 heat shock 70 kDa protein 12A-like [Dreissena polymorpha]KAH3840800.1 hypothetical protein DPMN_114256 [Dreissena polymorpha]
MEKRPLVAAVDIGTSWSSWVISFRSDVSSEQWQLPPHPTKMPTAVLITPDGKNVAAFGLDAEAEYSRMASTDAHCQHYYFRLFKLALCGTARLTRETPLKDISGKSLPAMTVFSLLVGYIRQQVLSASGGRLQSANLRISDIHWILTIPAMWSDASKQFMREAAEMAGLPTSNLSFVFEADAALIGFGQMASSNSSDTIEPSLATDSKYLVVEAGGGVVELGAYRLLEHGQLQQLHVAYGGNWGGAAVEAALKEIIAELFSQTVYQDFKNRFPVDDIAFLKEFNIKMRGVSPCSNTKFTLHVPEKLNNIYEHSAKKKLRKSIIQSKYADEISLVNDHLEIDVALCRHLFDGTIDAIIDHMTLMLQDQDVKGASAIVMTGGLSRSLMLQTAIKNTFPQMEFLTPGNADEVVLKGAVELGHSARLVQQRKCSRTYGLVKTVPFDEKSHDQSKRIESNGKTMCKDIFDVLVEAGQTIDVDDSRMERVLPLGTTEVALYATSAKPAPMYVTDAGCQIVGKTRVDPKNVTERTAPTPVVVLFAFSGTEVEVYVKDKDSGAKRQLNLNCLI